MKYRFAWDSPTGTWYIQTEDGIHVADRLSSITAHAAHFPKQHGRAYGFADGILEINPETLDAVIKAG